MRGSKKVFKMDVKRKQPYIILIVGWFTALCFGFSGIAQAATLKVRVENDRVYLHADKVSLISVLKAIAEKADIVLESGDPLTNQVSLDLTGVSIEEGIRRLLAKKNYSLTFKKTGENRFAITEIRIIASGSIKKTRLRATPGKTTRVNTATRSATPPPPVKSTPQEEMEDPFRKYEKDWFKQELENSDQLADEITMEAPEESMQPEGASLPKGAQPSQVPPLYSEGIKVKEIATASVFTKIGLKKGDVIRDVNGQRVKTKEEFIKALQKASEGQSMIRIERTHENNMMNPIYIELNSSDNQPAK